MALKAMTEPEAPAPSEPPALPEGDARELLAKVDVPQDSSEVLLSSGRRYSLETRPDGDRVTVRARTGEVLLQVSMTDSGPVLRFQCADVQVQSLGTLALEAKTIELRAGTLRTEVAGEVSENIGGGRHTRIAGADRREAASIQTQANDGGVEVKAAGRIALDGEHIGLNDDACPAPFGWSAIAKEEAK